LKKEDSLLYQNSLDFPLVSSDWNYGQTLAPSGYTSVAQPYPSGTVSSDAQDSYNPLLPVSSQDEFTPPFPSLDTDFDSFSELSRTVSRPKRSIPLISSDSYDSESSNDKDQPYSALVRDRRISFSPDSVSERISNSVNSQFITASLFKIYHDSMENALSCWLNERTCPYKHSYDTELDFQPATSKSLQKAWAPSDWTNRIFQRVCQLDSVSGRFRDRPLTQAESAAASKALYLVIMAFASQWSQSSKRSKEQHYPMSNNPPTPEEKANRDYDRMMQEEFWHEARRALLQCADVESFKVAFANILFSIVQKPISKDSREKLRNHNTASLEDDVERLLAADGPPIYLEQGVRHAHSLRHKLRRREREQAAKQPGVDQIRTVLSTEDRTTVDMIAWLGYMLESLTSAIHERPLVVSDEDCDVLPESFAAISLADESPDAGTEASSRLWSDYFFLQEAHNRRNEAPLRYPCSYDEAAAGLTDAAPIKVLLYRKIISLQVLMGKNAAPARIEQVIKESLDVYAHWGANYEPFVNDCISQHGTLQPRIQSWYICLTAHWHLAALTFVDTLEAIDATATISYPLCSRANAQARLKTRLVPRLRAHNAYMVSELARVSTPVASALATTESEMQRIMHFAVSAGALLTEPWTDLLVRVFAKAAVALVQEATANSGERGKAAAVRADHCVRALKYLGKKSDSARLVGDAVGESVLRRWGELMQEMSNGNGSGNGMNGLANGNGSLNTNSTLNDQVEASLGLKMASDMGFEVVDWSGGLGDDLSGFTAHQGL
jgi:hypothetical protein